MTNADMSLIGPLAIPTLLGLVIPLIVNGITQIKAMPQTLQSILYAAFSALAAVVPTVTYDNDLKGYLTALCIAWLVSMRSDYTGIPDKVIPKKEYVGRHRLLDTTDPTD